MLRISLAVKKTVHRVPLKMSKIIRDLFKISIVQEL